MKLARGYRPWVGTPLLATALLAALRFWSFVMVALLLSLFMLFFHRDPERVPEGDGVLAPADGVLIEASSDKAAIFMGHHNVHVNRAPVAGKVKRVEHRDGGHLPAFLCSSSRNEQNLIVLETDEGEVELRQITGALVRRIICYVEPGDRVERGERIGMIRFGSRMEFSLPAGYEFRAKKGDRVRAGETVVAVKKR